MAFVPFQPDVGVRLPRRRRSSSTWTPAQLTNLRGWWDAALGITIATGVSQWDDQSGNGNNLLQAVGANQPTVTASAINGLPGILFDGTNANMTAAFTLTQPLSVLMVARQVTWASTKNFHDGITAADTMLLQQFTATPNLRLFGGASLTGTTDLAVNTYGVITEVFNGASSSLQIGSGTLLSGNAGAASPGGITLGSRQTATAFANVEVAEIIVMAAAASADEITSWKAYALAKFGI